MKLYKQRRQGILAAAKTAPDPYVHDFAIKKGIDGKHLNNIHTVLKGIYETYGLEKMDRRPVVRLYRVEPVRLLPDRHQH